ncbi:MAG: F0F1 ATP synthase subunit epsilon [Chloroflexi bacterium]|nr:F0F1 ATP synthase subunit epsilon [Chloroflexota bacterium]
MSPLNVEIITAERKVYSGDADMVIAPGAEGQLGILPHHAPLLTSLHPGELRVRKGDEEVAMCLTGGFMEVLKDKVSILADACERAEEIDIERAEAALRRAEERLKHPGPEIDHARAEAALRRSLARIRIAEKMKKRAPRR